MLRRPPRSTLSSSSAASDVYKRQDQQEPIAGHLVVEGERGRADGLDARPHLEQVVQARGTQVLEARLDDLLEVSASVESIGPASFAFDYAVTRDGLLPVSYTHLRAHETRHDLVCR